jgi:hypothetical protein
VNDTFTIIACLLDSSYDRDPRYGAALDFCERVDKNRSQVMNEFLSLSPQAQMNQSVSWRRVPASRLKRIWLDFGKSKVIRDEKGLDQIVDLVLENIARIKAITELSGHEDYSVKEWLEAEGIELTPKEWERFWNGNFITNQYSDYAMKPLENLYSVLFQAESAEQKLYTVDRILNVVHQRGDLADLFVEGGSRTLMDIFNQGGYTSDPPVMESEDEDDFDIKDITGEPYKSRFMAAYIEALFFTEQEHLEEQLNESHESGNLLDFREVSDLELSPKLKFRTSQDCEKFEAENGDDLSVGDTEEGGYDFWLTRNRHGCGYWDGDWPEPQATRLTEAAHRFGEMEVYLGDDGLIYGSR